MCAKKENDWFGSWFDSPYYGVLYQNRDDSEAKRFIQKLLHHLQPPSGARILDLACGRGRHSKEMARLGYEVTGIDLSPHAIQDASEHCCNNLQFEIHDMREVYLSNHFDCIFNLFTSFGYFNDPDDNRKVLDSVVKGLVPNGIFALDFLNSHKVQRLLIPKETKVIDGISFHIERQFEHHTITKKIHFSDQAKEYAFEERVTAFTDVELKTLLANAHLDMCEVFGDYNLNPFDLETSDRLILIARKSEG